MPDKYMKTLMSPAARPREPRSVRLPAPLRALLRVPIFYKLVIGNAVLVALTALVTYLAARHLYRAGGSPESIVLVALAVVALTIFVNAVIVRLALSPLSDLEETAARVQAGDLNARAEVSPLADEELIRLGTTLNAMLESAGVYRQRLREIAKRAQEASEEERKRISRELHDETAQTLAALMLRLRLARGAREPELRESLLEDVREEIAKALEGIRRFAQGLRPPALEMLGLVRAIEGHARELSQSTGLPIEVRADAINGALSPEAELAVYRVVQEALSNVLRHAQADRAIVTIRRTRSGVHAVVEDDGKGFDPGAVNQTDGAGLGLFGMHERAAYVGGEVEVDSRPGRGTRVHVDIPTTEAGPYV